MWIDDDILRRAAEPMVVTCWVPAATMVVLGSSNQAEVELNLAHCADDQVPILKRYGGGGAVVLHSGCAVVSVGLWVRQHFHNSFYFRLINQAVIQAFARQWPA